MNTLEDKENFGLQAGHDFSKGIRGRFYRPKKISTTIRIDDDVVLYFKKLATEKKVAYQTLMNEALRVKFPGYAFGPPFVPVIAHSFSLYLSSRGL